VKIITILADMLGGETGRLLKENEGALTELRLRIDRPAYLRLLNGNSVCGDIMRRPVFQGLMNCLMENSLYAREEELRSGYFTSFGGCRVGVCGHVGNGTDGIQSISGIASACIRIPREIIGCADALVPRVIARQLHSLLIISPPGMGKTTVLRDLARQISNAGFHVALVDERRELAACADGVPQLDVGKSTDVMDGLDKIHAIPMLIRACAPDLIVVDELGGEADVRAVMDAAMCGVAVAASIHAGGIQEAVRRPAIAALLDSGIFHFCAELGPVPGKIKALHACVGSSLQTERVQDAESFIAGDHTLKLYCSGPRGQRAQKAAQ